MTHFIHGCLNAQKILRAFASDERGATAIEYGIIAAGVAAAIASVVSMIGAEMSSMFYSKLPAALAGR